MLMMMKDVSTYFRLLLFATFTLRSLGVELSLKPSKAFEKKTGDNFMIQCKLSDLEDFSSIVKNPTWTFVDENEKETLIPTSGRRHIKFNDQATTNLLITNAVLEDAGKYKCSAEVTGSTLFKEIQVTLYQSIQLVDFKGEQHPTEGTNAEIYCKAFAKPKPEITWFKKQKNLNDDTAEDTEIVIDSTSFPRYTIKDEGQTLAISAFDTAFDNGVYKCTINQFESADMKEMNITVIGYVKPEIKHASNGTEINEGSSGDLSCGATGVPVPKYNWYKDDSSATLTEGDEYSFPELGLLRILKSTPEDAGSYKCEAYNLIGRTTAVIPVTIFLKPIVTSITNATAKKEEPIEIACVFSGGEPLKAVWMSKDGEVPIQQTSTDPEATSVESVEPLNRYVVLDADKKTITLYIRKASVEDSGEYQCLLSNKAGSVSQPAFVKVEHKPQINENSKPLVRAVDTTAVELWCTAEGLPLPDWLWYNPSGSIIVDADGISVVTTEDKKKSSLKMTTAADKYGSYRCVAQNQHGSDEKTMEILKIEVPQQPAVEVDGTYPTRARLFIKNYLGKGEEPLPEKMRPDTIEIKYTTPDKFAEGTPNWDDLPSAATYEYDSASNYDIYKLTPKTSYIIAVRGKNEAGDSDWFIVNYETAKAEAPKSPTFATPNNTECLTSSCVVEWEIPDDGGSSITNFILLYNLVQQQPSSETGSENFDPSASSAVDSPAPSADAAGQSETPSMTSSTTDKDFWKKETVPPKENKFEIKDLQSKTTYKIRIYAVNDIGDSPESADLYIKTREFSIQDIAVAGVNAGAIVAIVIIVVLIIVLIVDVACYYVNQCGLLMCICVNCCGKTPPEVKAKEVAMEEGKATSEDKKPLRDIDEGKTDHEEDTPMITEKTAVLLRKDTSV